MADTHLNELVSGLSGLYSSEKYSDLVVTCGNRQFKVHRAIVCLRCPFFAAACDGNFKEASSREIHLKEDDPDTVGRMIDYLYTYDYWDGSVWPDPQDQTEDTAGSSQRATKRSLMVNVQVYAIAGKYGIGDLMLHATNKFDRLVASRRVDETFCAAIREVYSSTPAADRGLRDLVTQTAFANIAYLVEIPEFVSVLEEFGEFAIELLRMTAKRNEELEASAMACVTDW